MIVVSILIPRSPASLKAKPVASKDEGVEQAALDDDNRRAQQPCGPSFRARSMRYHAARGVIVNWPTFARPFGQASGND
jgi:hypothetical protein